MPIKPRYSQGFTLIETLVFIVVVSIALGSLMQVYNQSVSQSVDPIVRVRLLELAQSKLDEVVARKYDHNTPSGGIPACNSAGGTTCTAVLGREGSESCATPAGLNDVDDFNGCTDTPYSNYTRTVTVYAAGTDLGLSSGNAKRIEVTVTLAGGETLTLSSYRANF